MYATKDDLISEGADPAITDTRAALILQMASNYIDLMTGQWFEDRAVDMMVDGHRESVIFLPVFAREIESITIDGAVLDPEEYTVYNRFFPDDRRNPKIAFFSPLACGRLNIKINGTFGFVDKQVVEGVTTYITPPQIKKICLLLAFNEVDVLSSESRRDLINRGRLKEEMTDKHSYTLQDVYASGAYTGDPEIDQVLIAYRKPVGIGSI